MSHSRARPSAGLSLCVAPVVTVGINPVDRDHFPGLDMYDGDLLGVDEEEHAFALLRDTDSEVVESSCSAGICQGG